MGKNKERQKEKLDLEDKMDEINSLFGEKYHVLYESDEFMIMGKGEDNKEKLVINVNKPFSKKKKFNPYDMSDNAILQKGHIHSYINDKNIGKLKNLIMDCKGMVLYGLNERQIESMMRLTLNQKYYDELRDLLIRKQERNKQKYVN